MSAARRNPELRRFADKRELAEAAARSFADGAAASIAARGRFAVALAGGSTPRDIYARLAQKDLASALDWTRVHVFFGDERCVPATHADSNFKMAAESLLWHVPIPPVNQHRMRGEDAKPEAAAAEYEAKLRAFFAGEAAPRFDLVLLGLGPDGHTASLFPGSPALAERARWVVPVVGPKPPPQRITLTYPALNGARAVAFLVAGEDKRDALTRLLATDGDPSVTPARGVAPTDGSVVVLADSTALGSQN
jgi:6-phosphogluconolactonase